jgi:hypothetical protein
VSLGGGPATIADARTCRGGAVAGSGAGRVAVDRRPPDFAAFAAPTFRARRPTMAGPRESPVAAARARRTGRGRVAVTAACVRDGSSASRRRSRSPRSLARPSRRMSARNCVTAAASCARW